MPNKLVFTHFNENLIGVLINDKEQLLEVHPFHDGGSSLVGTIYVGKVMTVKENIQAAFVDIGEEHNVFLSIKECRHILYSKRHGKKNPIVQGDEILVQITKDGYGNKLPKAVTDFSLAGKYVVLTTDRTEVFVSSKIVDSIKRDVLKKIAKPLLTKNYGFIMRTNCKEIDEALIVQDIHGLVDTYNHIVSVLPYRSSGQKIHTTEEPFLELIKNCHVESTEAILFDDKQLYEKAKDYCEALGDTTLDKLVLGRHGSYQSVLNLNTKIEKLLHKRVWLKSGGTIVIEPTEALVSIDVNTEKSNHKSASEETVYKTNIEAATEIMRQIRARNLAGIIIIDFIDMKKERYKQELMVHLRSLAKQDSIKTVIVDMTPLGLVEITRKKTKQTLEAQLRTNER